MDEQAYNNIAKKFSGEASEEELKMLQDWLAEDPKNKASYEDLEILWNKSDKILHSPSFNTGNAWEKVSGKLQLEQPGKRTIIFAPWIRYSVAAAAVLLIGVFAINNFFGNKTITIAAVDDNLEISLPDNSHIFLRKGSTLHYPKIFRGNERKVTLEGEAFFEVARNERKPFVIDAQTAIVKVLGTSFDVKCNESEASVVVKTGKVQMSDPRKKTQIILTPGEKGLLKNGELTEQLVKTDNLLYWQTGILNFTGMALADIINELREIKNATIMLDPGMPEEQRVQLINITFSNQSLEEMLTDLCLVARCQWSKQDNTYHVSSK